LKVQRALQYSLLQKSTFLQFSDTSLGVSLPEPIQNAAAAAVGGTGYLVGGLTPEEMPVASVVTLRLVR